MSTSKSDAGPLIHLCPIQPREILPSLLLRIAARNSNSFQEFSRRVLRDETRVGAGYDAFPNVALLKKAGAISAGAEEQLIVHHTLLGATKLFRRPDEWSQLVTQHCATGKRLYTLRKATRERRWHICPGCRAEEESRGILIWERTPQLPGIYWCGLHQRPLAMVTSTWIPSLRAPSQRDLSTAIECNFLSRLNEAQHIQLARDIDEALASGLPSFGPRRVEAMVAGLVMASGGQRGSILPVSAIINQVGVTFGSAVTMQPEIASALNRLRRRPEFFTRPSFASLTVLAMVARSFGSSLSDMIRAEEADTPLRNREYV